MREVPAIGDRVRLKALPELIGTVESFWEEEGRLMCFVKWDNDPEREKEDYLDHYKLEVLSS